MAQAAGDLRREFHSQRVVTIGREMNFVVLVRQNSKHLIRGHHDLDMATGRGRFDARDIDLRVAGVGAFARIVATRLQDKDFRVRIQHSVEPRQHSPGRIAVHAGVRHRHAKSLRAEDFLQLRGKVSAASATNASADKFLLALIDSAPLCNRIARSPSLVVFHAIRSTISWNHPKLARGVRGANGERMACASRADSDDEKV